MNQWLRLLDRMSPDLSHAPSDRLRARVLIACSLLFVLWAPIYAAYFYFAVGLVGPAVAVTVGGCLAALVLIWFRRSGNQGVAGALLTFMALGILLANAWWFGGLSGASLTWVPVVPLVGVFIAGRKTGWTVSVAAALAITALYLLGSARSEVSAEIARAYLAFSLITILPLALSLALAYEALFERALVQERKASEELRRAARDLELARRDAEAASAAKSQFLANMSHEIRTPLNGVLGMLALASDTELTAEQRELLETAHSSGEALLRLVNDVLDVSKLEAHRLDLEVVAFSPEKVIEEALAELAVCADGRGVELARDLDEALAKPALGDPFRFRQIVTNLLSNAIKFTEEGSVVVRGRRAGEVLEVAVTDTGIGMSAEVIERIFAPFSQADTSTTRRFGGTGLGLAICSELAARMHGSLKAESRPGEGSTFTLRVVMPLAAGDPDAAASRPQDEATPLSDASDDGLPLRVLVAEDNKTNARLIELLLKKLGHQVKIVETGLGACDAFDQDDYDLVLMDLHMPELGGLEATRRLRERGLRVPIVALTASVLQSDVDACTAAGMNGFLSKPIKSESLRAEIARLSWREL